MITSKMQTQNDTAVEILLNELSKQFTVLGSKNENINAGRSLYFKNRCNLLNEYVEIPEGYCKYFWDEITCYPYTPPFTTIRSKCASWPMHEFPPENAYVERRCLNGTWENISTRTLEMLYQNCKVGSQSINNTTFDDDSLNMGARYIALTGYFCSAIVLLITIILFIFLKKLNCGRNWIHFNLFISFLLRFFFCAAEVIHAFSREEFATECSPFNFYDETFRDKIFILAWNYSIVASYFWIFIEGLYLHNSIYFYVFHESSTIPYVLFGWVTVSPMVVIAGFGTSKALFDNTRYWLAHCDERISWIIRGPLITITIAELIVTVNIIRQLYSKVKNENYLNERERYRKFAKSFLYLLLSIGGTYLIFDIVLYSISFINKDYTLMVHRAYIVTNSLWGLVIAYIYCFNNAEIRREIHQKFKILKQNITNYGKTPSEDDEVCQRHAKSPFLSLSNNGDSSCPECALSKKLLNLNNNRAPPDSTYCSTLCSTVDSSAQNTLQKIPQRVYPRVTYLSFCREEGNEIEITNNDL